MNTSHNMDGAAEVNTSSEESNSATENDKENVKEPAVKKRKEEPAAVSFDTLALLKQLSSATDLTKLVALNNAVLPNDPMSVLKRIQDHR